MSRELTNGVTDKPKHSPQHNGAKTAKEEVMRGKADWLSWVSRVYEMRAVETYNSCESLRSLRVFGEQLRSRTIPACYLTFLSGVDPATSYLIMGAAPAQAVLVECKSDPELA